MAEAAPVPRSNTQARINVHIVPKTLPVKMDVRVTFDNSGLLKVNSGNHYHAVRELRSIEGLTLFAAARKARRGMPAPVP